MSLGSGRREQVRCIAQHHQQLQWVMGGCPKNQRGEQPVVSNTMLVQQRIRNHIIESFLFGSNSLKDEDSFLERGVVDSTGVLELVLFAEEAFSIAVNDDEILPENFDSISNLARYVSRKQGCIG
jgi:acyl carrier protein